MEITGSWILGSEPLNAGLDGEGVGHGAITELNDTGVYGSAVSPDWNETWKGNKGFEFHGSNGWTGETSYEGNGQPHDNMPPYIAVYRWRRIA
jgi:hypothetical protein